MLGHLGEKFFVLDLVQKAQLDELFGLGVFRLGRLRREHVENEMNSL